MSLIHNRAALQIILFVCALLSVTSGLRILAPAEVAGTFFASPEMNYIYNVSAVTGQIVSWELIPEDLRATALQGKIIFTSPAINDGPAYAYVSWEETWRQFRALGAIAAVYTNPYAAEAGFTEGFIDELDHSDLAGFLATEMAPEDGIALQEIIADATARGVNVTVTIDIGDPNMWRTTRRHGIWYAWQAFFGLLAGICAVLAFAKWLAFARMQGLQFSLAQICLAIEWLTNTVRLIYMVLDPLGLNRGILTQASQNTLLSITWPFEVVCILMVSLYWHESITKTTVKVNSFLSRLKVPFIVATVIIFILEITSIVLRSIWIDLVISVAIASVIYVLVVGSVAVYFFVIAAKTLQQLHKSPGVGKEGRQRKKLYRVRMIRRGKLENPHSFRAQTRTPGANKVALSIQMTAFVVAGGSFQLLWVISALAMLFLFYHITGFYTAISLCYFGVFGCSFSLIMTFATPQSGIQTGSGKSATSKTKETNNSGTRSG